MTGKTTLMDHHLLLQFGERLRALRKARGLTADQLAKQVGITRKTLGSVESGDPASGIGTYVRVMSALGISGELALLAAGTLSPPPPGSAAARSKRNGPVVTVEMEPSSARHKLQDLQSMALHVEAVRLLKKNPALVEQVRQTLERWIIEQPASRSMSLWLAWRKIIANGAWNKAISRTGQGQQLRQASPLGVALPAEIRKRIRDQVASLKAGIVLTGKPGQGGDDEAIDGWRGPGCDT